MSKPQFNRRTLLRLTGAGIASVGATTAVSATEATVTADGETQNEPVEIKHSQSSGGGRTYGPVDERVSKTSQELAIVREDGEPIEFGGNTGRALRITNTNTGRQVTLESRTDTEAVTAYRLAPTGNRDPDRDGLVSTDIHATGLPEREESGVDVNVDVTGDADPFPEGVFGRFTVELLDENGAVLGTTGERIVGTGYEFIIEQEESTVRATRHPGVEEEWQVGFLAIGDETSNRIPVENSDDDEQFEVDLTELDVPPGEYSGRFRITAPDTDFDGRRIDQSKTIIMFAETVEIGGEPSFEDYTDDEGEVDNEGLFEAATDFRNDDIGSNLLFEVAAAWR